MAKRKSRKFVAAIAVCLFNLSATFVGVYAWFTSVTKTDVSASYFEVENKSIYLENVKLIKFDYKKVFFGNEFMYDYDEPATGAVKTYNYNDDANINAFGFQVTKKQMAECTVPYQDCYSAISGGDEEFYILDSIVGGSTQKFYKGNCKQISGNTYWECVNSMNLYDPAEKIIRSTELEDLYCNAVYELTIKLNNFGTATFELEAEKYDVSLSNNADNKQIKLSTCVDFDAFTEAQLSDNYNIDGDYVYGNSDSDDYFDGQRIAYYPNFKKNYDGNTLESLDAMSAYEEIYYKVSYLSFLTGTEHSHFYGSNNSTITITQRNAFTVTGDANDTVKIYINVNYSADELDQYAKDISISNVHAKIDFKFKIKFYEASNA